MATLARCLVSNSMVTELESVRICREDSDKPSLLIFKLKWLDRGRCRLTCGQGLGECEGEEVGNREASGC